MEELEKWQLVNSCENYHELTEAIRAISPVEYSSGRMIDAESMFVRLKLAKSGSVNLITRNYGLRAKVMYLQYYNEK